MNNDQKTITSVVYKSEVVNNTQRKFGSSITYYPCYIEELDGTTNFALFTERELENAILRGAANPEDIVRSAHTKSNTDLIVQKIKDLLAFKLW